MGTRKINQANELKSALNWSVNVSPMLKTAKTKFSHSLLSQRSFLKMDLFLMFLKLSGSISLILLFSFTTSKIDPKSELDVKLHAIKEECKQSIQPSRYEGSRTTYYTLRTREQVKEVELLSLSNDYVLCIGAKNCSADVTVRFYDQSNVGSRKLIHEEKWINGKSNVFRVKDLNEKYFQLSNGEKLNGLYIEYEIAKGKQQLEGIVLVIGSEMPYSVASK